jgi:transcriptional regulator SbtR-like protein
VDPGAPGASGRRRQRRVRRVRYADASPGAVVLPDVLQPGPVDDADALAVTAADALEVPQPGGDAAANPHDAAGPDAVAVRSRPVGGRHGQPVGSPVRHHRPGGGADRRGGVNGVASGPLWRVGAAYRDDLPHFPTRADLVVAVYRHQVEACAEAGPALLADAGSPFEALRQWVGLFVDFLVTKHGLANALQSDASGFDALHAYFLDRLVPVCEQLLDAAAGAGEIGPGTRAYELMRGIGNLCVGRDSDPRYDPRRLIELLLRGLRSS